MTDTGTASLLARSISLVYGDGDSMGYAVKNFSIDLPARGFFGVMGPSGSGKSSLLYLLSGLKRPSSGDVFFEGRSYSSLKEREQAVMRRRKFGFVFQMPYLIPYLTARENILAALEDGSKTSIERVDELLTQLGIYSLGDRYPSHLSGGERQRIVVARALAHRPQIIFADEPTAALDHTNGRAVVDMLAVYRSQGAVLVVSHDPAMLTDADHIYQMADGELQDTGENSPILPG